MKYATGFLRFWYDFIVGDSVILAIGGATVLIVAYVLVEAGATLAAEVALPLIAISSIVLSLPRRR
jgi:hypothetical protein